MGLEAQRRTSRAAPRNGKPRRNSRARPTPVADTSQQVAAIASLLRGYADRGVFRGCSEARTEGHRTEFTIIWHYDRVYRFIIDTRTHTVSLIDLLPDMRAGLPMMKELRAFIAGATSDDLLPHRRVDPLHGALRLSIRNAHAQLTMKVLAGDYEYCVRRLVHLVQEVFVVFLRDGPYYDYRIESLGVDPDNEWA